jgi:hypothetical protein
MFYKKPIFLYFMIKYSFILKNLTLEPSKSLKLGRAPSLRYGSPHSLLHPQPMLWFTYYKGTFSTFVFASQNRAFMLRSVLRTLRPSMRLTQKTKSEKRKVKSEKRKVKNEKGKTKRGRGK